MFLYKCVRLLQINQPLTKAVKIKKNLRCNTCVSKYSTSNKLIDEFTKNFPEKLEEKLSKENRLYEETYQESHPLIDYEELFREIAQDDEKKFRNLKKLDFERALLEEQGFTTPSKLSKDHWCHLLTLESVHQRKKFLKYLFLNEKKNENAQRNKKAKNEERKMMIDELAAEGHLMYGLGNNSLFIRVYEKAMRHIYEEKMFRALMFSQTVVFDCSYDEYMSDINSKYCAHQLEECVRTNRKHRAPFHVKLCNYNDKSATARYFQKFAPTVSKPNYPWDIHKESYLEFFPKDKIVYLTPHCNKEMKTFNHDDVYIIGAFVDKGKNVPVSLAKAKELNLRTAKFPLDNYLDWKKGAKTLALNKVLDVLLDMRLYNDWNIAFKNIPSRFLVEARPKDKKLLPRVSFSF